MTCCTASDNVNNNFWGVNFSDVMKLNYQRLSLLRDLDLLGTIAAVARANNLSRSAVSQQLSLLEQEVGEPLFLRSTKGGELNDLGQRLAFQAARLVEQMAHIENEITARSDSLSGVVRIAAFGTIAFRLLPQLVAALEQRHPALEIHFQEAEPEEGIQGLKAKSCDLAIIDDMRGDPALSGAAIDLWPLCHDRMMALTSIDHPLAAQARSGIALRKLAEEAWALNVAAGSYQSFVTSACRRTGFLPRVVRSCRNMALTAEFVRHGRVVTVLPELALDTLVDMTGLVAIPITPEIRREIFCAVPRGAETRAALRAIIREVRRIASRQ